MLAIVVTLGGYFVGLHWLISPPDPWQPNARISAANAQQLPVRKRPPRVRPVEAATVSEAAAATQPDARPANVETSSLVEAGESEEPRPIEPNVVRATQAAAASPHPDATQRVVEPVHAVRRELSATKTRPGNRKRVERNTSRKLELMVLRTYERSDGKRFTRLLPMSSARNAMAFQPDDPW
jgi:hypothetical protein